MLIFMDTSALVKRYIEEQGSFEVDAYYSSANEIAIAPITPIEFHSALSRKREDKSIEESTYDEAIISWRAEKQYYNSLPLNDPTRECAIAILKRNRLRTLDSIQLASAILISSDEFVVADKQLFKVARELLEKEVTLIE